MNFKPYCVLAFALYFGPFAGISRAEEMATATTPISSMPDEDSDVDQEGLPKPDGLSNQDEALVGTDPLNPDSDDDELLDGAEAVPLSDKMKAAAARELRYAVVRLGQMKSALGVNSKGEVLLVDYGGSGTTQGYLWKDGVSQSIGTGLRGSFRGPMEDGTVYFATPTEETMFTDSFGLAVSFKSKLMAWKNGGEAQAGLFYETNFWDNRQLPAFPTTHPTTEFLNEDTEGAYTSAWTAMKSAIPPAVPPNFAFSPQGFTSTTSSGGISRINDLGDKTYTFSANFSSPFSGPLGDSYSLPAQIELTGWMSLMPGFSAGEGYWKLNNPPEPNDTTNLPRNIMVNNGLRAVGRTNGGVIKWLVPGPNDIPIPNVSDIFDLNNSPNEGPYMLGSDSTGNLVLLCHGGGAFPRIPLNGLGTISQDAEAVVSRKISDNLLIPADTGIWRNQRFRPLSEITSYDPNGQDYFTINQVSPTNDFLLGYGYFGDEFLHEGVLLVPADIAVDANRDGVIKFAGNTNEQRVFDKTTEAKPFRFWCNDDNDGTGEGADDPDSNQKDSGDSEITSWRDLEDFTRLHLNLGGLQDAILAGTITVGLEWRNTNGTSPSIKIYRAAEIDGGDQYLKSTLGAGQQTIGAPATSLGTIHIGGNFTFPTSFWKTDTLAGHPALSANNPNRFLLFEGATEGKGQLVLTFWKENTRIGEGPGVRIELLNVKKMYQRGHAVPNFTDEPFSHMDSWEPPVVGSEPFDNNNAFSPAPDEEKKAVVYVHGINGPGGQSDAYATWQSDSETVFKRLWHQGFKGRFASFKWLALTPAWPFKFNESEYRGWKSGQGLAQFLETLPSDYEKNLYSFSQGAIVCGSALSVYQASVQNYVMSQAAAPAGCYDTTQPTNSYADFLNAEANLSTPDSTNDLGYRGYLSGLNVGGSVVSFFNQADYALKTGREAGINVSWEGNQLLSKPNQNLSGRTYAYDKGPPNNPFPVGQRCFLRDVGLPFNERRLTDIHESMSFVARPRSEAAGASDSVAGRITSRYNIGEGTTSNFGRSSSDHGGQFSRRIQETKDYYRELGLRLGVLNLQ